MSNVSEAEIKLMVASANSNDDQNPPPLTAKFEGNVSGDKARTSEQKYDSPCEKI